MKKITFILLALVSGTVFAQNSANASAEAFAEIVQPISIDLGQNLVFGRIIASEAGGTVTINPSEETREFSNGDMEDPSDLNFSAATFTIDAASGYNYSIVIDGDENLTDSDSNGGVDMPITYNAALGASLIANEASAQGTAGTQLLTIGGELTVNGSQTQSNYSGDISVTVTYE